MGAGSTVALDIRPLTGMIGAEVFGVDLAALTDAQWEAILDAWYEHLVLFFPGQDLAPDAHVRMGERLGELEIHPFIPKLDDEHPEIVVIDGDRGYADVWHTDVSFTATPPLGSILHMVNLPSRGGDTLWSNQYVAYETLSPPLRVMLEGLTAVHTGLAFGHPEITARHPVVRVHPVTGRAALYVNRSFTSHFAELRRPESDAVLAEVLAWCEQANFQCRYRWTEGTVAMWDNRCTQHFAVNDYDEYRRIERVTVLGDAPIGLDHPGWPEAAGLQRATSVLETDQRTNSIVLDTAAPSA